jgi:hypothetical protein
MDQDAGATGGSKGPSYEPVEGFLRNEATVRFPVGWVPTSIFDWTPLSERLPNVSSSTDENYHEQTSPDNSQLESSTEVAARLERRRERMVSQVWRQLSKFHERNGYKALHKLRESLRKRWETEHRRAAVHQERVEYLSTLKADLRSCMNQYGEDATLRKTFRGMESNRRAEWSRPRDHRDVVTLSLPERLLEKRGIDPDNLSSYPWTIGMDQTLDQAFMKLHRKVESEGDRVAELGDLLGLIHLRLRLLRRRLWITDLGLSTESPPTPSKIPESIQGSERAVQYCWMILSVIKELTPEWPTQSELAEMLEECYDFDSIPIRPESAVDYASQFIRAEFSERYQDFRPDFYRILQNQSDSLSFFIGELELELLDQVDVPD